MNSRDQIAVGSRCLLAEEATIAAAFSDGGSATAQQTAKRWRPSERLFLITKRCAGSHLERRLAQQRSGSSLEDERIK